MIIGHTDSMGSAAYNDQLSVRRAEAVKNLLMDQFDIDTLQVTVKGMGESQPLADNQTQEGRRLNRRVDISIIKK